MRSRPWTTGDIATLKNLFGEVPAKVIAEKLGRSLGATYQQMQRQGLRQYTHGCRIPGFEDFVLEKNAAGWSDQRIADHWGVSRDSISKCRRRLGLDSNKWNASHRAAIAKATKKQCREFGVKNLGEISAAVRQREAARHGWPAGLRVREAEILNYLEEHGPSTQRQIAEGIGMVWNGPSKTMSADRPGGTWLAYLQRVGCVKRGKRNSGHSYVYELTAVRAKKVCLESALEAMASELKVA